MYIVSTDIHPQTDTLVHDENKETLAPLTPPPITHTASTPSSQLSQLQKLYKYTHTLSHIHTHPHTPFFLLTPFPAHHGSLQLVLVCPLAAAACTRCVCACECACARVCLCVCIRVTLSFIAVVPAELRHVVPTSGPSAWERKWTVSHVLLWPPLSCEILQPPRTQSVLHLRAGRGFEMSVGNLDTPRGGSLLFLCIRLFSSTWSCLMKLTISVWNHPFAYPACFGVHLQAGVLNTKCFLFDAMCEVINLIATATECTDSDACRKHPRFARIYGGASGNVNITHEWTLFLKMIDVFASGKCFTNQVPEMQRWFKLNLT